MKELLIPNLSFPSKELSKQKNPNKQNLILLLSLIRMLCDNTYWVMIYLIIKISVENMNEILTSSTSLLTSVVTVTPQSENRLTNVPLTVKCAQKFANGTKQSANATNENSTQRIYCYLN